ncbi:hypothetical protein MUK70_01040 [Dyadobacter chenwenxiniae]|uniref:Uncharacterized protein n=1 Tax=Dyadobacter chenwenxiniae TaxID=2906456 RepID=A0A9X1TF40_9BACT|nr:hypothetical protein [Dyadobacter chenwenxiniae]MCF0062667.1 hypothetical protein [Dyadobacter chenwenxiniae]UON83589.1 hypothetical protein MUK70_01040 [Dyadobacter chenwenxiniae]
MKIGEKLQKLLNKKYEPNQMRSQKFERYDISFKTDQDGNPVVLFIGVAGRDGRINGNRFVRVMIRNSEGEIIKDHWDAKGKV